MIELVKKYATLAWIAAALIVCAAAAIACYQHGYSVAKAKGDLALETLRRQEAQASVSALSGTFQSYVSNVARGQQAEQKFALAVATAGAQKSALKGGIDAVTQPQTYPQSTSGDRVIYRCVFSDGFVRLWNAAAGLDADSGGLPSPAAVAGAGNASNTGSSADSGVSQADLIDWFVDYSNRARVVESQLKSVIAAYPGEE